MNKNKKIALLVIAIIVVIVCVVLAEKYVGVSNNSENSGSPVTVTIGTSTTPAPTSSVSVTITPTTPTPVTTPGIYKTSSYSFTYPTSWSVSQNTPGSVNNFADKFGKGGILPPSGAEVIVATTSVYGGNWQSVVTGELISARNLTSSTIMIDGTTCAQENFVATYGPGAVAQNVFVYCPRGTELVKIYAAYPAGDPKATSFMAIFRDIFNSFKFL